jgi:hypothetical protein
VLPPSISETTAPVSRDNSDHPEQRRPNQSDCSSPTATRTAVAADTSPPGTGQADRSRTREVEELQELLEASNTARAELEMALLQTETSLSAAQLEIERIQITDSDDDIDDLRSVTSDGSGPSDDDELDDPAELGGADVTTGTATTATAQTVLNQLMRAAAERAAEREALRAKELKEHQEREARRKEVNDLHLPTEQQPSWSTIDWDASKFRDVEQKTQTRRKKPINTSADAPKVPKPRKGRHGWRHNSRQGLVGAMRYWAGGSRDNVIHMLLGLINEFAVADAIRSRLFRKAQREVETDRLIVDRLVEALEVLKGSQTEQQRKDYKLALSLVAPPRVTERSQEGTIRRTAARLRVSRGKRSKKRGARPYAFETAVIQREAFDQAAKRYALAHPPRLSPSLAFSPLLSPALIFSSPPFPSPSRYSLPVGQLCNGQQRALVPDALQVGEKVLTHNGPAELTRFTEDGGCVVTYRVGDDYAERKYTECYSKAKGSARLRRIPPSLTPPPRAQSALTISDSTRKLVLDHLGTECPMSSSKRDVMRRRVGPFVVQEKNAYIMSMAEEALYDEFTKAHPSAKLSLREYKNQLPWHRKHAYRETCLDRLDLNFEWHWQAFKVVMEMLAPLHSPATDDAEGEAQTEAPLVDPLLKELANLAAITSRTAFANALVCSDCLGDDTKEVCLNQDCLSCSFARLWSRGLRPKVMALDDGGATEAVRNDVSSLWEKQLSWDMVKSADDSGGDGRDLRHTITGTVVEALDACQAVFSGWVPHRYHAWQAHEAETECDRNLTPAKLRNNSDWSENGEIVLKLQMQSEYWSIKYYSLLISITSFLLASAWKDREGALKAKAEVTVQPDDAPEGSVRYVAGSYFAVVHEGSAVVGAEVPYVVRRPDGSTETVPRHRLRHRVWHHVAFLGVTNEKQHVATTTQTFFSRQLEFWRLWNDKGRNAAHAFAANDRASAPPTEAMAAAADRAEREAADVEEMTEGGDVEGATMGVETEAADAAAANAAAAAAAAAAVPPTAAAISAAAIAAADPDFAKFLASLDDEEFTAWLGHTDNASHFKSSNNLHWWSNQLDSLSYLRSIWIQYGCPGKGKGAWDGLGAMVKTKVSRDITNGRCLTQSKRIRSALEVAEHLRNLFSKPDWLRKHAHTKINEIVVMYIDKDETDPNYPRFHWPTVEPKYSTFSQISKKYCFLMRGGGRAAGKRFCCFCERCCLALEGDEGSMTPLLEIPGCRRCHLSSFKGSEQTITCTAAAGLANAKARAKALWAELKRNLKAGKHVAIQVRELWSTEERRHLRPGHFWGAELADADGKGSPIIHTFTRKNEYFTLSDGRKMRGDAVECLLLLRRYFHRTPEDLTGLTFRQQQLPGEILVVNSSELRAVQGHQKNDFVLRPINPPKLRQKTARAAKKGKSEPGAVVQYCPRQKWGLDPDIDRDTRKVCEGT